MNRNEEYNTLLRELDQTPPELEYTVTRAKARARRHQARRWVGVPVGTLAGTFAAFVLLVNTVPTFALACSHVPVLGDLAAAVDWSGSLSRAVEHDYVQVIGQSQTKDGITMAVEYVIVDQQQVNLFVCVENEDGRSPIPCSTATSTQATGHFPWFRRASRKKTVSCAGISSTSTTKIRCPTV